MDLLATRRGKKALFFVLYLAEGAPIGFLWWALPTRLRAQGLPVAEITTLTAALALPWAFKFVWAPLVDALRGPRWGLRSFIVSAQLVMGVTLLPLLVLDLRSDFAVVFPLLIAHAIAAATQDVAVDALAIANLGERERGSVNGWMQAGMLTGRSVFGGGVLMAANHVGLDGVVLGLVAIIWLCPLVLMAARPEEPQPRTARRLGRELLAMIKHSNTWLGLGVALVGGAAFEAVGAVAGPLLVDRGMSQTGVGVFLFLPAVAAMVTGALVGGRLADKLGHVRTTTALVLAIAGVTLLLSALDALLETGSWWRPATIALLYLGIGAFTAASYALFMDLTRPNIAATQFSAFMGATNGCEAWAAFSVGRLAGKFGYSTAFTLLAVASLLALPALITLEKRRAYGSFKSTG